VFSSTFGAGSTGLVVIARDTATNAAYSGGWSDGSNGGTGFGPWSLTGTGSAGRFIADNPANLSVNSSKGFGLWANGGGVSVAQRDLTTPLVPGDVVTVRFDNNWIDNGGSVGIALADAGNTNRFAFYFIGGQTSYRINDDTPSRDTAIGYTDLGLLVSFELLSSNSYRFATGTNLITGTLAAGGPLVRLIATNFNAGPNTERNFYLGELTRSTTLSGFSVTNVTAAAVVRGGVTDTDGDGLPDAWETQYFGSNTAASPTDDADGDGFNNLQEFLLGTHPRNSGSTFGITTLQRTGSQLDVTWSAVPGKVYQLQSCPTLDAGWTNAGVPVVAQPGDTQLTRTVSSSGPNFFVRVILAP
jgi:hypothetical protein